MRLRRAAGAVLAAVLAGCGGGEPAGLLEWKGTPQAFAPERLPTDRVVVGTIRNSSLRKPLRVEASRLKVFDAAGNPVRGHAQFTAGYAHGLYGAYQKPKRIEESELTRLGLLLKLEPGREAPLYVAYRLRRGLKLPLHVDYGEGTLRLPDRHAD